MAQYFFSKYKVERVCSPYGEYVEGDWEVVSERSVSKPPLLYTKNSYTYDKYDQSFYVTRGELEYVSEHNRYGEHYFIKGGDLYKEVHEYRNIVAVWTSVYRRTLKYVETGETCRDVRGSYVGTVTGTANQYPSNGVLGGYWYVRGGEDVSPMIYSPTEGDIVSGKHTVKWDTTINYGSGTEGIFLEVSTDGGITWQDLFRMGSSAYNQGEMEFDFNRFGNSTNARIRMYAVVNGDMTTPNETGKFTLIRNRPPNMPERETGGQRIFHRGERVPITWKFLDDDIDDGDYQTKAVLRITDATTGSFVKEVTHEGERTTHFLDISSFTPNREYSVRVTTYDRMGESSPQSLAMYFYILDFVPQVEWLTGGIVDSLTPTIKFSTNFKYGRSTAYIYDMDDNLIEEGAIGSDDDDYIVSTPLNNLESYKIVIVPTGDYNAYGGGDMQEFSHVFMVKTPAPKDITLTLSKRDVYIILNLTRTKSEPLATHFHVEKYINGEWEIVIPKTPYGSIDRKVIHDMEPFSGTNRYRVIAYSEDGSYSEDPTPSSIDYVMDYDSLRSLGDTTNLRLKDIIKLEYEDKPEVGKFQFLGSNVPHAEYGEFRERKVSIEMEVYKLKDLVEYRRVLTKNGKFLYRDREGRVMLCVVENYHESETYNPHWYYVSFDISEVGGGYEFAFTYNKEG